jgi:hypothetical protein
MSRPKVDQSPTGRRPVDIREEDLVADRGLDRGRAEAALNVGQRGLLAKIVAHGNDARLLGGVAGSGVEETSHEESEKRKTGGAGKGEEHEGDLSL